MHTLEFLSLPFLFSLCSVTPFLPGEGFSPFLLILFLILILNSHVIEWPVLSLFQWLVVFHRSGVVFLSSHFGVGVPRVGGAFLGHHTVSPSIPCAFLPHYLCRFGSLFVLRWHFLLGHRVSCPVVFTSLCEATSICFFILSFWSILYTIVSLPSFTFPFLLFGGLAPIPVVLMNFTVTYVVCGYCFRHFCIISLVGNFFAIIVISFVSTTRCGRVYLWLGRSSLS